MRKRPLILFIFAVTSASFRVVAAEVVDATNHQAAIAPCPLLHTLQTVLSAGPSIPVPLNIVSIAQSLFTEGTPARERFLYATPWTFGHSMNLLRSISPGSSIEGMSRDVAFTLASAIIHSGELAETHFSPPLIGWALNHYSILDMSWVRLRDRITPVGPAPSQRIFVNTVLNERFYGSGKARDLVADRFSKFLLAEARLKQILTQNWKNATVPSASVLEKFEVEIHVLRRDGALFEEGWLMNWRNTRFPLMDGLVKVYRLGLDAPFGIVLKYNGEPVAVTSFDVLGDSVFLSHIQGSRSVLFSELPTGDIKSARDALGKYRTAPKIAAESWIDIPRTLYSLVEAAARDLGYEKIIIQGGRNNKWIKPHGLERPDFSIQKAESIYDATAIALGAQRDRGGNWVVRLAPEQR